MSQPPLASILINNYNYGQFISEAIQSALSQTYPHCEVIVVDDGSKDNSREVIESYHDSITSVFQENSGQAAAMNAAFQSSKGEIIFFLDSDDIFDSTKVEKIVKIFQDIPAIGWCFHPLLMVDQHRNTLKVEKETFTGPSGTYDVTSKMSRGKLSGTLPMQGTATSGMSFRRSFLETLLPIPEELRITSDNYLKYAGFGLSPGYILLEYIAYQRIHDNNAYTLRSNVSKLRLDIDIITAYWLRKNFPTLSTFSNNLFAYALSRTKRNDDIPPKVFSLINQYRKLLSPNEKIFISLKRAYYSLNS